MGVVIYLGLVGAGLVTAAAISEAQNDILAKFDRSVFLSVIVWQIQMYIFRFGHRTNLLQGKLLY